MSAVGLRRHRGFYSNSAALLANAALMALSGIAFWAIAARRAPAEEVGVATSLISFVLLVSLAASLGLDVGLLRLVGGRPSRARPLLFASLAVSTVAVIALSAILVALAPTLVPSLAPTLASPAGSVIFTVALWSWTQVALIESALLATSRADLVLVRSLVEGVVRVALVGLLATAGPHGILLSFALAGFVSLGATFLVWRVRPGSHEAGEIVELAHWSAKSFVGNMAQRFSFALPLALGSAMVLAREGGAEAGRFYVLWMIGTIALTAPLAFGRVLLARSPQTADDGPSTPSLLAISAITALLVWVGGVALLPLFGEEYANAGWVSLAPFVFASIPCAAAEAAVARYRRADRNRAASLVGIARLVGAILPLALGAATTLEIGLAWLAANVIASMVPLALPVSVLVPPEEASA